MTAIFEKKWWGILLLSLAAALLFVWSIGDTIALRNLLLAAILLLLLPWGLAIPRRIGALGAQGPWWGFLAVTVWLLFQAIFLSPETSWALANISGQWVKAGICLFIGFGTVLVGERLGFSSRLIALVVVGALGLECLAHSVDSLWLWFSQGTPPFAISRLTGSKERISYVNNLFFSILAAEFVARACFSKRFLPIAQKWLYVGAAIVYFNSWVIGARNGEIGALVLTFSVAVFVLYGRRAQIGRRNLLLGGLGVLMFVLLLGYAGYRSDSRWGTLLEQASMGWQTDTYRYWINEKKYPKPVDKEGREVSLSNYLRIAWIKEGAKIVADTPWGVGFGRTAFGHALVQRYPQDSPNLGAHSHSGIIDWTIGTGWVGLALWLVFLGIGLYTGIRGFALQAGPAPVILFFLISGYFFRSLVDSNIRDHMLEQFMFLYGAFYLLTIQQMRETTEKRN